MECGQVPCEASLSEMLFGIAVGAGPFFSFCVLQAILLDLKTWIVGLAERWLPFECAVNFLGADFPFSAAAGGDVVACGSSLLFLHVG